MIAGVARSLWTSAGQEERLQTASAPGDCETLARNSPDIDAVTHGPDSITNPASGCHPHGEIDCKGKNEQFNIDVIQINLN